MNSTRWRYGLLTLSAGTIGLSLQASHHLNSRADCLARYNEAYAAVQQARSDLGTRQNAAVNDVLSGSGELIAKPPETPAQMKAQTRAFQVLFARFRADTDQITAERAAHPLPANPKNCR